MEDDPLLPVLCVTCGVKYAEQDRDECFRCRVSNVSFNFVGGGGYGRQAFQRSNTEFMNEHYGFNHPEKIRADQLTKKD